MIYLCQENSKQKTVNLAGKLFTKHREDLMLKNTNEANVLDFKYMVFYYKAFMCIK
jgi:hypothetical protein